MKTVYTTLPIYKAKRDQYYERGLANGAVEFAPIFCPRHRLPSFQWMDDDDGATEVTTVYLMNETVTTDITSYFSTVTTDIYSFTSAGGEVYFIYNGNTLNYALPIGSYYLKIVMDNNYEYYSDWFTVQCVYCPFAEGFTNVTFDTFTASGTDITASDAGANAYADSTTEQSVYLGQQLSVILYLTLNSGTAPSFSVVSPTLGTISNVATASAGANELTLTMTRAADDAVIRIQSAGATNFETSEILIYTQYACGYITLSFSSCCNLGDLLYEDDFLQTLWIKSDNIEPAFPYTEKGQENGLGKFIPTFRRQDKTYVIRTGLVSQYMIDVLNRLKMHDEMTYIDQVGDAFVIETVDTEAEWIGDNKYYANATITIDLGESITTFGCC